MLADTAAFVYWGGMLVLFFFWVYGIVSFGFDLKNKIVPGLLQYRRGRRRLPPAQRFGGPRPGLCVRTAKSLRASVEWRSV